MARQTGLGLSGASASSGPMEEPKYSMKNTVRFGVGIVIFAAAAYILVMYWHEVLYSLAKVAH